MTTFNRFSLKHYSLILLLVVLLHAFASSAYIVLYADAAYYLFSIVNSGGFELVEPTSMTVQLMQQFPVVTALALGVDNLSALMIVAGAANLFLPLVLTSSCYWILPEDSKSFILFPILHYIAGTLASWFPTVTDAPLAAAYFWVLFYLIIFRINSIKGALAFSLVAIPALYLHEGMSFLSILLIFAAAWKAKNTHYLNVCIYLMFCIFWFAYIAWHQTSKIIQPRSVSNRDGFVTLLLDGKWIYWDGLNVTVVLSVVSVIILGGVLFFNWLDGKETPQKNVRIASKLSLVLISISVVILLALVIYDFQWYGVVTQFAARAQSAFVSVPLAGLVILSITFSNVRYLWEDRLVVKIVTIAAIGVVSLHAVGLWHWSAYVRDFQYLLELNKGHVPYVKALKQLPAERRWKFQKFTPGGGWPNPIVSYLLSPQGQVSTLIGARIGSQNPLNPCLIKELPSGFFNVDMYKNHILSYGCSRFEQHGLVVPHIAEIEGLYHREQWGRWSKGKVVELQFDTPIPENLRLVLHVGAFGPNIGLPIKLSIGSVATHFTISEKVERYEFRFHIPEPGKIIRFIVPQPVSPKKLGVGSDERMLGIRFKSLEIYSNDSDQWVNLDFTALDIF